MGFSSPSAPSSPPPPAQPPQSGQGDVQAVMMADQRRRRASASNTILTSGQGVQQGPMFQPKSLLGSNPTVV